MKLADIPTRVIAHEKDVEYFTEYPAPLQELIHCSHFTNVNSTITFFGPMLYFLARAIGAEQVLEIGHAEGYTSHYLAHAVKDNAVRFGMAGNKYYGIDIVQTDKTREALEKQGLPVDIRNLDSLLLTSDTFKDITFDLIFQDGCHDTEHVLHELKVLYPQLKGEGKGFWVFHDALGPAEEGFREVEKLIKQGVYDFQYVVIPEIYGIAIMRKMSGYDYEKRHWWENGK